MGRKKINKKVTVEGDWSEEDLSTMAYNEIQKHLASRDVWLEPNEEKGNGFWKVYVGMGYHVGDVEINKV